MLLLSLTASAVTPNFFLAGLCAFLLLLARPRVARTTLAAPWAWAIAAIAGIACVEALAVASGGGGTPPTWAEPARYAAAMLSFCPMMGVLGAKRPQDRGWFWVVLCLWLTLALPSGQWLLVSGGEVFDVFLAWKLFVACLMALTLLNYLPTRHWLSAALVVVGQWLLVSRQLPMNGVDMGPWRVSIALGMAAAAILWGMRRGKPVTEGTGGTIAEMDDTWLSFRNAYGAFWGLRILQRVNQTAQICDWPVRLEWQGFMAQGEPDARPAAKSATNQVTGSADIAKVSPQQAEVIGQTLRTLLRRFV